MKCKVSVYETMVYTSRPIRGAWIEILDNGNALKTVMGRAPYGARGLKCKIDEKYPDLRQSRAPHGARGLKSPDISRRLPRPDKVAPRMGRVD